MRPELGENTEKVLLESTAAALRNKTVLPKKRQLGYLRAAVEINEGPRRYTIMADTHTKKKTFHTVC